METINRDDLLALLATRTVTLVEALPAAAYDAEHLPCAVNVPGELDDPLASALTPDRAAPVVVYCSGVGCARSRVTAAAFLRLGYTDVRVYAGGKADWVQAGLPLQGWRAGAAA